jgi:exopolysaccharide biosynthesis polyprenyl glycosylphosphotransferase
MGQRRERQRQRLTGLNALESVGALDPETMRHLAPSFRSANGDGRTSKPTKLKSRVSMQLALRRGLVVSDVVAILAAFSITQLGVSAFQFRDLAIYVLVIVGLAGWFVLANAQGLYENMEIGVARSALDDLPGLALITGFAAWVGLLLVNASGLASPRLGVAVTFWILALVLLATGRALTRALLRRSELREPILIVGSGRVARRIADKLGSRPKYGLDLVGFLDDEPFGLDLQDPRYLGTNSRLEEVVRAYRVERVVVAFSLLSGERQVELLRRCAELGVRIEIVPRMYEVIGSRSQMHDLDGIPLLSLKPAHLSGPSRILKRSLDLVVSASLLVILSPVIAAVAVRIKMESPGPVFFRQERMGAGGRRFQIVKFRSMYVDADAHKSEVGHLNKHNEDGPRMFKVTDDPRITPFGRFLRRSSLDELPQLFNVVRGEMSLVGPRPLILNEDENIIGQRRRRLKLTPGVTGPWQVLGRSDIPFSEMLMLDYLYVTNWSLWGDVKLLFRTVPAVLSRRGAY